MHEQDFVIPRTPTVLSIDNLPPAGGTGQGGSTGGDEGGSGGSGGN